MADVEGIEGKRRLTDRTIKRDRPGFAPVTKHRCSWIRQDEPIGTPPSPLALRQPLPPPRGPMADRSTEPLGGHNSGRRHLPSTP